MKNIIIGIDIAKYKFDVAITNQNKPITLQFKNNQEGFNKLLTSIPEADSYWFVMEATGNYGKALSHFLYDKGHKVSVLNPAQIKYYAKSKLVRAKTDKVDAIIIAEFAIAHPDLPTFKPLEANLAQIRNLSRCLLNLKGDAAQVKTRIKATDNLDVNNIYHKQLAHLNEQINELKNTIVGLIKSNSHLATKLNLLQTIPAIGLETAIILLAELPNLEDFKHAKQLSAFIGLNPTIKLSGKSVRGRSNIGKMGNKILRKALFLPAMVACRFNPILKDFAYRLESNGKNGKLIIVAVMRKLTHLIFAILKKSSPFNPNFLSI